MKESKVLTSNRRYLKRPIKRVVSESIKES